MAPRKAAPPQTQSLLSLRLLLLLLVVLPLVLTL